MSAVLPKVYTNGHKTLNVSEARAHQEMLKSEKDRREYFNENKHKMIRARNPLTGEATPRDGIGEPIINPNWIEYESQKPSTKRKKEKELTDKIGIKVERYDCLGNSYASSLRTPQVQNQSVILTSSRFPPPSRQQETGRNPIF